MNGSRDLRGPFLRVGMTRSGTYTLLVVYVLSGTPVPLFFPLFPEVQVHRRSADKRSSVSKFKGRVGKTDKLNVQRNRRGGIRL